MPPRAEADARQLFSTNWLPIAGSDPFPVDPVRIAASLGVDVFNAQLSDKVAGALVKEEERKPTILLNEADSPRRRRFTCAHEIGHFILRTRANPSDDFTFTDFRSDLAATGEAEDERYANGFAAELLMPFEQVVTWLQLGMSDIEMASAFDVSFDAVSIRVKHVLNRLR